MIYNSKKQFFCSYPFNLISILLIYPCFGTKKQLSVNEKKIVGPRKQIEDVIYTVTPTAKFSAEVKAANKRISGAKDPVSQKIGNQ